MCPCVCVFEVSGPGMGAVAAAGHSGSQAGCRRRNRHFL